MIPYSTKSNKLPGTSYSEVRKNANTIFKKIKSKTKRNPYIRSAYFDKDKVFFNLFWIHLIQKSPKERFKRLKYFGVAIEVVERSRNKPSSKVNPNKQNENLHRFAGLTRGKELFYVQIKENKKTGAKYFMSCFPPE